MLNYIFHIFFVPVHEQISTRDSIPSTDATGPTSSRIGETCFKIHLVRTETKNETRFEKLCVRSRLHTWGNGRQGLRWRPCGSREVVCLFG